MNVYPNMIIDPNIHLEQHAVFGWHTWNSNCWDTKLICTLVHEHCDIFLFVIWLTCEATMVVSWQQLGMVYRLACVYWRGVAHACVCNDCLQKKTQWVIIHVCWLSMPHLSWGCWVVVVFLVFFLIIIIVVTQDKNLLNQAAIINGFHYKVLNCRMSVFILYLNQNGNEEWWPFIVCLNQVKQAHFVVLKPQNKSHFNSRLCVVQPII